MNLLDSARKNSMPERAPLDMGTQNLSQPFKDPDTAGLPELQHTRFSRFATMMPAVATTFALIAIMVDWFGKDGFAPAEVIMLVLVTFSAFWIALSVAASTIGLLFSRQFERAPQANSADALDVALLVPIYNENAEAVFSRIAAMRDDLSKIKTQHRFAVFILSDTNNASIAAKEHEFFETAQQDASFNIPIYYRRRAKNTERKTGNIRQWVENWGDDWSAFITLDADSLMSAATMTRLADELVKMPETALLQTIPKLMGASSYFARVQQFANNVYGSVLADGLDRWSGHDGNYWGHNAIIRTKAFATCAGLPQLEGKGALGGIIKSHDFVEAALLRRAGWSVRLMPHLDHSYEETPQTIVDYVLRDRRWCQGNLQHLKLILSPGFTAISRFHMLQGAMSYIASVVWFLLLIAWALMGRGEDENVFQYFTDTNPLFPQWPEMDGVSRLVVLMFMFGLLLVPKLLGLIQVFLAAPKLAPFGGKRRFFLSAVVEILSSFVLAPILMVQHVNAVVRTVFNRDSGWAPQNRDGGQYSWLMLSRFHWLETLIGGLLLSGTILGVISLWLVPIALSLSAAIPISYYSGKTFRRGSIFTRVMETEDSLQPTPIVKIARLGRQTLPET